MCILQSTTTAAFAPHSRVRDWNHAVSRTIWNAEAQPDDAASFLADLKYFDLGSTRFARLTGGPCGVTHRPQRKSGYFLFAQVVAGAMTIAHGGGRYTQAASGDFWLHDLAVGGSFTIDERTTIFTISIPRDLLVRHLACPEAATRIVVSGNSGAAALASRFLRDFWLSAERDLTYAQLQRFAAHPLQIIASAYAAVPEIQRPRAISAAQHRLRIRAFIEEHLCEPSLTPRSIADALRLTPGYIHRVFTEGRESVARYIQRRRLEEVFRALHEDLESARSITTVAFDHGFNSLPHFCRAFRERYGVTASDVQRKR